MKTLKMLALIVPAALTLALSSAAARAADPSVDEIVRKTNYVSYYQGTDGRADVRMKIVDKQGRERQREFIILRRDEPEEGKSDEQIQGDQQMYVYFERPADVNKMVFMVHKHLATDDDRWLYMPALDLVKRISSADKRTSFVGSNFFYEDVSGRHIEDDVHELVETTNTFYVLKNTPKDKSSVEFKYFKMWIHKDSFVVVKTEYYDAEPGADGKDPAPYRTYEALGVEDVQGFKTVDEVEDDRSSHRRIYGDGV